MNKILTLSAATLVVAGALGASAFAFDASAVNSAGGAQNSSQQRLGNGRQTSLESRAKAFGMSVEDLEKALETKTMSQIAVERGMSETDFRANMEAAAKARWEARGLSDEEIAERATERKQRQAENQENCDGFGSGTSDHAGGYGRTRSLNNS